MATTFDWIYLGTTTTVLDPTEGNNNAENAASLVGTTYGTSGSPLYNSVNTVTMINNGGSATALDQNNTASNDQFTTNNGSGTATYTFDSTAVYNATITYTDGTTATVTAVLAQDTAGNLYLAPESTAGGSAADTAAYQAKPIQSITLTSLSSGTFGGLAVDRVVTAFDDGIIDGTSGSDAINGTYVEAAVNGSDRVDNNDGLTTATTNDDNIRALGGNDTVTSGVGNDQVYGGDGNDQVFGGDGNDYLDGGTGSDAQSGGAGDDTFILSGVFGADTLTGGETTETTGDVIIATSVTANTTVTFSGADAGTLSDGTSTVTFSEIERILLGTGNDSVFGGAGNDQVDGGAGNDSMAGGAGNDSFVGGDGSDTLDGGTGADLLTGGAGDDTFVLSNSFGADTMTGGETTEVAGDTLNATGVTVNTTLSLTGAESGTLSDGTGTATFSEVDTFLLGSGNDTVFGGAGNDQVDGGAGNDSMAGAAGNDSLTGGEGSDTLDGGAGADVLTGGVGNDVIFGGAGDVIDGGADTDVLDLSAFGHSGTNIIYGGGLNQSGTVQFLDVNGAVTGTLAFAGIEQIIACFATGTKIDTDSGVVPVEALREGSRVLTRDSGYAEVIWAGRRHLSQAELRARPALRPVRIAKGMLGHGLPTRDLLVSPQHRMLWAGARAELLFGEREVLIAAIHLVGQPGISQVSPECGVTYHHIMFDQHEIIRSEGTWSESFQPGAASLNGLEDDQRAEILDLFPVLATDPAAYPAARPSLKRQETRVLFAA